EEQILRYLARGFSNKQIGHQLEISDKTVKHYLTSLMQKLQVRNRVEAALMAAKRATPAEPHTHRVN
ncbi:response regulator transcription factor, partial [Longimicrobium sp.]|uniref:response regulator transcription factor n=1 Tax=Longimicrobium sp. TaxID=2029185 RepID=UPI002F94C5EA